MPIEAILIFAGLFILWVAGLWVSLKYGKWRKPRRVVFFGLPVTENCVKGAGPFSGLLSALVVILVVGAFIALKIILQNL